MSGKSVRRGALALAASLALSPVLLVIVMHVVGAYVAGQRPPLSPSRFHDIDLAERVAALALQDAAGVLGVLGVFGLTRHGGSAGTFGWIVRADAALGAALLLALRHGHLRSAAGGLVGSAAYLGYTAALYASIIYALALARRPVAAWWAFAALLVVLVREALLAWTDLAGVLRSSQLASHALLAPSLAIAFVLLVSLARRQVAAK